MTAVTRIAFVSDVHGNLPALEAVLEDLEARQPFDRVVGGGDYAASGAFPQECLARMMPLGWDFVRGNADEWMVEFATDGETPAVGYVPESVPQGRGREALVWGAEKLTSESVEFLSSLEIPWSIAGPSGQVLVYVHATPSSTHFGYAPDADESIFVPMFGQVEADVLLHGHIHHAYLRRISVGTLGCVGSVGMPYDRDPRPCYLIATDDGTGWSLEHHRVSYDNEAYISALLACGIPDAEDIARRVRAGTR